MVARLDKFAIFETELFNTTIREHPPGEIQRKPFSDFFGIVVSTLPPQADKKAPGRKKLHKGSGSEKRAKVRALFFASPTKKIAKISIRN